MSRVISTLNGIIFCPFVNGLVHIFTKTARAPTGLHRRGSIYFFNTIKYNIKNFISEERFF